MNDTVTMLYIHIGLSFMALALGFVAICELSESTTKIGTEFFLAAGVLTTLTGFFLPFETITPPVIVGIISSVLYLLLLAARFAFHNKGLWRAVYVVGIVANVYFLTFVTVTQAFLKIPSLNALAPTLKELPFSAIQIIVLVIFVAWGRSVLKKFRPN